MIPVVLDAGTDNQALLAEDMYLGNRHPRVRGERYDELIDAFVAAATRLFPNALLHWEDFGAANAHRILTKYAGSCRTFNDDMQGTAAVVLAAALGAIRAAGTRMRDQTVVIHGAGTAGIGIADALRQVMIADGLQPLTRPPAGSSHWTARACSPAITPGRCGISRFGTPARPPKSPAGGATPRAVSAWPRWWPAPGPPC